MSIKFIRGIIPYNMHLLFSSLGDILMKLLSNDIAFVQIVFLRHIVAAIILIPVILYYNKKYFYTDYLYVNFLRGFILSAAFSIWIYGLQWITIPTATVINFTTPFFIVILSYLFLKEPISKGIVLMICCGFIGALITLDPNNIYINPNIFIIILAPALFALTDIINKYYVDKDSMITSLFYTSLAIAFFAAIPTYYLWQPISYKIYIIIFIAAIVSNLLFWFLLKAYSQEKVSFFAPYRYMEIVFSIILSYFFFHDSLSYSTILGAIIIIPSSLYSVMRNRS